MQYYHDMNTCMYVILIIAEESKQHPGSMKVLIVYAHMTRGSMNGSLLKAGVDALHDQGHTVTISDLHAMNFNPVISPADIKGYTGKMEDFHYLDERKSATVEGRLAEDIMAEQDKVRQADLIIFQFPICWGGPPAILKGWLDRVLVDGFAFDFEKGEIFHNGCLKGKRAVLSITTGGTEGTYSTVGIFGDVNVCLWPIQYMTLHFCGLEILPPHLVFSVLPDLMTSERAEQVIGAWTKRLNNLDKEQPLTMLPMQDFNMATMQMTEKAQKNYTGQAPSIGQNMGRGHQANSMVKPASLKS